MDAKKLIESVQMGMDARVAVNKVLAEVHGYDERVLGPAKRCADMIIRKLGKEGKVLDPGKFERLSGEFDTGNKEIEDDQELADEFFGALGDEIKRRGYTIGSGRSR